MRPRPTAVVIESSLAIAGHSGEPVRVVSTEPVDRTIEVRVVPRARRDEVGGERDGRLLVRTTAPPVDGAANEATRRLIAAHLGVHRRNVTVIAGEHSRDKVLRIDRNPLRSAPRQSNGC